MGQVANHDFHPQNGVPHRPKGTATFRVLSNHAFELTGK
jgi:hypothetical protein